MYHYVYYGEVLMLDEDEWSRGKHFTLVSDNGVSLDLPRVCRQLYQETVLLLYTLAVFDFGTHREAFFAMETFLENRSEAHIRAIGKVGFWEQCGWISRDEKIPAYANRAWTGVYWADGIGIDYSGS